MVVRGVHLNVLLVVSVVARVRHPVLKVNLLLFQIQLLAVVVEVLLVVLLIISAVVVWLPDPRT
jgi:hypothetical protein